MLWSLLGCSDLHYYFPQDPMEMALTPEAGAVSVVMGFTSPDLRTWTPLPEPVAYGVSSLGLSEEDGALVLTGLQEVRPPSFWEEKVTGAPIRGLSFDGETWTPRSWSVDDPVAAGHIDPQAFEGGFWYIAPSGQTGDPAHQPAVPIRSSPPPTERFIGKGIADPAPIRIDGQLHVFATSQGGIIHLAGEPLVAQSTFGGATVPFPVLIDGQLHLLAQRAVNGRRQPVLTRLDLTTPDRRPTWRPLLELGELASCTSPVMGHHPATSEWLLLCVEERAPTGYQP
jgi:hypothetical protein